MRIQIPICKVDFPNDETQQDVFSIFVHKNVIYFPETLNYLRAKLYELSLYLRSQADKKFSLNRFEILIIKFKVTYQMIHPQQIDMTTQLKREGNQAKLLQFQCLTSQINNAERKGNFSKHQKEGIGVYTVSCMP